MFSTPAKVQRPLCHEPIKTFQSCFLQSADTLRFKSVGRTLNHRKGVILFGLFSLLTIFSFTESVLAKDSPSALRLETEGLSGPSLETQPEHKKQDLADYQEFYTIDESSTDQTVFFNRHSDRLLLPLSWLEPVKTAVVNLLNWALHEEPLKKPQDPYQRKVHFGRWINDPNDGTCMNTRARVLVRDSEAEVTYRNQKRCVVEAGKWHDPYANEELSEARGIQIDHMVPLKNAYLSGAADWEYQARCLYANYMNFRPHLVSAKAHENMSKGDRGPEGYLPPNEDYRCEYVRNWLAIKTIWKLKMNRDEIQAIKDTVTTYRCQLDSFKMSLEGLAQQRAFIQANLNFCVLNSR